MAPPWSRAGCDGCYSCCSHNTQRFNTQIMESLRLEKTSKIIKSNHQPNTTMPDKPCPELPHPHGFFFQHLQGWGLHHCPGHPGPMPDRSFRKEIFPNIESKRSLTQLEAISSRPIKTKPEDFPLCTSWQHAESFQANQKREVF